MKIIRWLLSHSLFILLIVAVIYAYMFWGNLLGKDTPAGKAVAYLSEEFVEVKEFVDAVKAKQAQLSEEKSAAQSSSSIAVADSTQPVNNEKAPQSAEAKVVEDAAVENNTEVASSPATESPSQPTENPSQLKQQPVVEQPSVTASDVQSETPQHSEPATPGSATSIEPKEEPEQARTLAIVESQQTVAVNNVAPSASDDKVAVAVNPATAGSTGEKFISEEVEKQLNKVNERGEVIDVSQPEGKVKEDWITARKAFYQRNYELSEKSYQQVIDNTADNFDAYGELGNVYFNQGKNKQAASAYFEAAAILVAKGQVNRARSLIGLLRHLDESKANELQQLIDSARS